MIHEMMWSLVFLFAGVLTVESYAVQDIHERLSHGQQLKIYLPKSVERLEFTPAEGPEKNYVRFENGHQRGHRGRVSGTGNDRRWYIDKVTYEDEGTYTQKDYWNKELSVLKLAITWKRNFIKRVPGETLYISLEGMKIMDASLAFSGEAANVTLVLDGALVSQDLPDYWDKVKTNSQIEIRHINTSDVGRYTLTDRRHRVVSVTRVDLTDHHDYGSANPLLALLLLLGIPAGICCCCRKKIFKQKATSSNTLQATPETVHPPPVGPAGPPPTYNTPMGPGAVYYPNPDPNMGAAVHPGPGPMGPGGQWNGPPPEGFNPGYPPQNPLYPPIGPAMGMAPPGPNPQWSGPPPGQYGPPGPGQYPPPGPGQYGPPGPGAPMGYSAPVMYSAPPPGGEALPVKMDTSPADPLLPPANPSMAPAPTATDSSYQFQIDAGKNSSANFL